MVILHKYVSWSSVVFISVITLLLLVGCASFESTPKEIANEANGYHDIEYTIVNPKDLDGAVIQQWVSDNFQTEGTYTIECKEHFIPVTYILIAAGEKPTGGYGVQIDSAQGNFEQIKVTTSLREPEKGETVTQAFTYPFVVLKVEKDDREIIIESN